MRDCQDKIQLQHILCCTPGPPGQLIAHGMKQAYNIACLPSPVQHLRSNQQNLLPTTPGAKASGIAEVDHLLLAHMDPVSGRLMEAEAVPSDMPMDRMLAQADGSLSLLVSCLFSQHCFSTVMSSARCRLNV